VVERAAITGLVLAGGRGSRMGGVDKGWLLFEGRPLVRHALDRLAPQVATLAISANRHLDDYLALGHPVWPDRSADFAGPLAGWQAALHAVDPRHTPWLASVPCDLPRFPADLVARLAAGAAAAGATAAYAVADGRAHPVCALLHTRLAPRLDAALAAGHLRVLDWLQGVQAVAVPFDGEAAAFANLNRPEDLASPGWPPRLDPDTKR
jgi:molybdopterin-guanine dinucleotide biosynthesis protein A